MYLTTSNYTDTTVGYITSSNYNPPSGIEYVAQLDGLTKYWQLSGPILLQVDDQIELMFIGGSVTNSFATFVGATNFSVRFDVDTTASFLREQGSSATLNGLPVESGVTPVPSSGENSVVVSSLSTGSLEQISSIGGARLMNLPVYNFRVTRNGTVIHEIPLTNKDQGATQLATVGNVNATMVGYTGNEWVDSSTL